MDVRYRKLYHLSLSTHHEVEERDGWCGARRGGGLNGLLSRRNAALTHHTTPRHYTVHFSLVLVCTALTGSEPDRPNPNLCPSMEIFSTSPGDTSESLLSQLPRFSRLSTSSAAVCDTSYTDASCANPVQIRAQMDIYPCYSKNRPI